MKLNIHLECFTMRKHPQQKKKGTKDAKINKITPLKLIHYLLEKALTDFFSNFACKLSTLRSLNP